MSNEEQVVLNGRYELHRRIGRGGMAEVYLARDQLLDRSVAIKILFPEFATDPSFVARFRREAQAAANLNHPNIVGVYDWGAERGTYYIVMEYVDGRSLSEILRAEGPLHPQRAADVAADVAGALGFAHRSGVVHRDVKPGNVIITTTGQVKVADFGIARAITASSEENLTQTGSVMGTATYFSPEQAQGKPVDPRSDLYSLGVVLYEIAGGKPPFSGDSPVAIAYKHVQEPVPPLRGLNASIPEPYEAITRKALAKNPANRYQTADEMRADLHRFRDGQRVEAEGVLAAPLALDDPATTIGRTVAVARPLPGPAAAARQQEPARRTGWFFVAIVVLLALLAAGLYAFGKTLGIFDTKAQKVGVPLEIGKSLDQARAELEKLGFVVSPVNKEDGTVPAGQVLDQNPKAQQQVAKGSTVTLTVAAPVGNANLPDVGGLLEADARSKIIAAGFANPPPATRETNDTVPAGVVIRTSPAGGATAMYPKSTTIILYVSSGPAPTTAPATTTTQPTTTTSTTSTTRPATTTSRPATTTTSRPTTTQPATTTTAP